MTELSMPQLSDTMTEGTLVKWHKKEGDPIAAGEKIADVETDKAIMEMEAFEKGTLAAILVKEGQKVPVGTTLAVLATGKENPADVKKQLSAKPAEGPRPAQPSKQNPPTAPAPKPAPPAAKPADYQFDIIVIGGGPAGYAAAIRAGQLKKRVLCVEKENLGGTCLNWGCIPTKALLEDGSFVRRLRTEAAERGVTIGNISVNFSTIIARSRKIADKLAKGIAHLFNKYNVKWESGVASIIAPHRVKIAGKDGNKEVTADHIIIATGARATRLPGADFDGKKIITSRQAMNLPTQPRKLAIIGAGAIGCEFADFYNALGTEVVIVEMMDHLLPIEDEEVSLVLERIFAKRGIDIRVKTKTDKVETTATGVRLTLSGAKPGVVEADVVLVAVGVTGNVEGLASPDVKLETTKNRVKVSPDYRTNLENVWAVGDCVALDNGRHPDLAHVAHHEATGLVERICGASGHPIDYRQIPACTYTHPQVASMGFTEKRARELNRPIRIGKFPFSASGRALAAGESDGFVKLIFDAEFGELLGAHLIGENVTELLAELVLAKNVEATEDEIVAAMHPHPTMSEAVMEAAGVAEGRSVHL